MKVSPKSENEIASSNLLPAGTYAFEIIEAEDQVSKNGNEMIRLNLMIFTESGSSRRLFDYLLASMERKVRNVAAACGLLPQYEAGELNSYDFPGKTGWCKVTIQKDKSGQYPDRNSISDYVAQPVGNASKSAPVKLGAPKRAHDDLGDEIPF